MKPAAASAFRRARGATLLEALVAFLVLSLGMLTMARVQSSLRLNSDIARQRTEAVRLPRPTWNRCATSARSASARG